MMTKPDLSTGESAIYDRQIRLWGSSSQLRIKSSTVLILGLTRTSTEIAKNAILAGANLILCDDSAVNDENRNFLIALELDDTTGISVGEATATAVKRLNEHPSVVSMNFGEVVSGSILDKVQSIVWSLPLHQGNFHGMLKLSQICREKGISFFLLVDSICINWMFSDFGRAHIVDSHTAPLKRDDRTGERKSDNKIEEFEFISLKEFISTSIEDNLVNNKSSFPRNECLFMKLFLEWLLISGESHETDGPSPKRTRRSASPSRKDSQETFDVYVKRRIDQLAGTGGRVGKFFKSSGQESLLKILDMHTQVQTGKESLPHMAAIHGALITQEVIKYITKRDPPLVNQIVLNPHDCGAIVVKTPMRLKSRVLSSGTQDEDDDVELVENSNHIDVLD